MTTIIESPGRVHITLLALDKPVYRVNGGIGFALDCNNLTVVVEPSKVFEIIDRRPFGLSDTEKESLISRLIIAKNTENMKSAASFTILSGPPPHSGFGTGTSTALSLLEGYFSELDHKFEKNTLITYSRRGGTSGIGVNTYFSGGFYLDVGQKFIGQECAPSKDNEHCPLPPLSLLRLEMPEWNFDIFMPKCFELMSGAQESSFFQLNCPISHTDASSALYHSIFGTVSGIVDGDYETFCTSINNIQLTKWKSLEIDRLGPEFSALMKNLSQDYLGVGVSSFGPMLYCFPLLTATPSDIISSLAEGYWARAKPNNTGRIITHV